MVAQQATQASLIIVPALFAGLVIGLYEFIVVFRDLSVHKFHAFHTIPTAIILTFISFNIDWALHTFTFLSGIPFISSPIGLRVLLFVIGVAKLHSSSMIVHGGAARVGGMGETWFHSILVGALIVGAPFIWPYLNPFLPDFAKVPTK